MNEDHNDNNRNGDYTKNNDYYELDYEAKDEFGSRGSNPRNDYNDFRGNEGVTISPALLETTSKWAGILGIITIISGVLTCLGALTTFGLSLIPGIITIILGVKLNNAKKSIDSYLRGDAHAMNDTFDHLGTYFKIQGILMIVSIVIGVLAVIAMVIFGIAAFSNMNGNMMY